MFYNAINVILRIYVSLVILAPFFGFGSLLCFYFWSHQIQVMEPILWCRLILCWRCRCLVIVETIVSYGFLIVYGWNAHTFRAHEYWLTHLCQLNSNMARLQHQIVIKDFIYGLNGKIRCKGRDGWMNLPKLWNRKFYLKTIKCRGIKEWKKQN